MTRTGAHLLAELSVHGVVARVDFGTVKLRPADKVPAELLPELRARRPEIVVEVAILAALLADPQSSLALAFRLGRPRDEDFYQALVDLLDAGLIETDPISCLYRIHSGARVALGTWPTAPIRNGVTLTKS